MSLESDQSRNFSLPGQNLVARYVEPAVRSSVRAILKPVAYSGFRMVEYSGLENLDALAELLTSNTLLVITPSHRSHGDILPGLKLVDEIRSRFPDQIGTFYIPIAASLARGLQGIHAQLMYTEGAVPLLNQRNVKPLAAVTENDQNKRHLKSNRTELSLLFKATKEERSAMLVFPEGSVESGRRDLLGNPRGVQKVGNPFLPTVFKKAHEAGKQVVVVPAAFTGTTTIVSAESIFLTWDSTAALLQDWIMKKRCILAKAVIGSPFIYTVESGYEEVNDIVMGNVAKLLPPKERGYYYSPTRQYQESMKRYEGQLEKEEIMLIQSGLILPPELRDLAEMYSKIS